MKPTQFAAKFVENAVNNWKMSLKSALSMLKRKNLSRNQPNTTPWEINLTCSLSLSTGETFRIQYEACLHFVWDIPTRPLKILIVRFLFQNNRGSKFTSSKYLNENGALKMPISCVIFCVSFCSFFSSSHSFLEFWNHKYFRQTYSMMVPEYTRSLFFVSIFYS